MKGETPTDTVLSTEMLMLHGAEKSEFLSAADTPIFMQLEILAFPPAEIRTNIFAK